MKKSIVFLAASLVLLVACKKNKDVAQTTTETNTVESATSTGGQRLPAVMPIDVNKDYNWPGSTDAFQIEDAQIDGDKLTIKVKFGGGCKEHGFYLHSNLMWAKSMPPKTDLYLEHVANGDNCRELIEQTLNFDLKPMQYTGQKQVKLYLKNGVDTKELVYQY